MSKKFEPHLIFLIFVAILFAIPASFAKDKDDGIDCSSLKNELRAKYKLAAKKVELDETEDSRVVVKQLEVVLGLKKSEGLKLDKKKAPEAAMNNRMEVANLEYEIDNLSEFVPEIKARKEKERKDETAKKKPSDEMPHYQKMNKRNWHPMEINEQLIRQEHGEYYTK